MKANLFELYGLAYIGNVRVPLLPAKTRLSFRAY